MDELDLHIHKLQLQIIEHKHALLMEQEARKQLEDTMNSILAIAIKIKRRQNASPSKEEQRSIWDYYLSPYDT